MIQRHRMIDGSKMVSYLRSRQNNLIIGREARLELEKAVIYVVTTLMKEDEYGEAGISPVKGR